MHQGGCQISSILGDCLIHLLCCQVGCRLQFIMTSSEVAVWSQLIATVQNTLHGAARGLSRNVLMAGWFWAPAACSHASTMSTVCLRSQVSLRPLPAHLSSAEDGCHGDCSQFAGSQRQSVIPNTPFTPFFPRIFPLATTLQSQELQRNQRPSFLHLSRSLKDVTNTAKHVSSLLVYKVGYTSRAANHRPTFLQLSEACGSSSKSPLSRPI